MKTIYKDALTEHYFKINFIYASISLIQIEKDWDDNITPSYNINNYIFCNMIMIFFLKCF